MRRVVSNLLIVAGTIMGVTSCSSDTIEIKGQFIPYTDSLIYIESFGSLSQGIVIDSAVVNKKGEFHLSFDSQEGEVSIYNLIYNHTRVPLLLQSGDDVTVKSIGDIVSNYHVEGSSESEQLRLFYQEYVASIMELNRIATRYASPRATESDKEELSKEYTKLYQTIRRKQIEYIVENSGSLAAVYAISQRVAGDTYIFNAQSDAIYYRTLLEALETNYPNSQYLCMLRSKLSELDIINRLSSNIATISLPEIELPDMYGDNKRLTESLGDKVTLLAFWSPDYSDANILNAELKEVYDEFSEDGFEIFQVALDPMKSRWISAVQEQRLPWICVNDQNGSSSLFLRLYNVTTLYANYLINNEGDIIERNVSIGKLRDAIQKELK